MKLQEKKQRRFFVWKIACGISCWLAKTATRKRVTRTRLIAISKTWLIETEDCLLRLPTERWLRRVKSYSGIFENFLRKISKNTSARWLRIAEVTGLEHGGQSSSVIDWLAMNLRA